MSDEDDKKHEEETPDPDKRPHDQEAQDRRQFRAVGAFGPAARQKPPLDTAVPTDRFDGLSR